MSKLLTWSPVVLLSLGALFTVGIDGQRTMDLRAPLSVKVPRELGGQVGRDIEVSKEEQRVAGMTSYVMRVYSPRGIEANPVSASMSVYVGFYAEQTQGRTIHSPKNCLPGSGWEALTSSTVIVPTALGSVAVNQYVLKRDKDRAVVLYWYQGRGRVEANEYRVKWNLLRDAAMKRRSDEALVRIVVPAQTSEEEALKIATRTAATLIPVVSEALPG